jgi:rSAM/selenodomain-associated transferase 2
MTIRVSVVIPSLNEEAWIEKCIRSSREAGAEEIVVADGGSVDATIDRARAAGAHIVTCTGMRSRQMNAGFDATHGDVVCFLHADTTLPPNACQAMAASLGDGAEFGGFRIRFAESDPRLELVAFMINTRTSLTRAPWGDQAQFFRRDAFAAAGRYPEVAIMEDYEVARTMKRRARPVVLPQKVTTSGRRFLDLGVVATTAINWRIIVAWHLGVSPETLRKLYGSR